MSQLVTRINDVILRISTENKSLRTLVNGNVSDNSALKTTAKTLTSSLNELYDMVQAAQAAAGATIDDAASTSATKTYSINKIKDLISTTLNGLTAGAPTALDTLDELAAALGDDANFAANITAMIGNRVRFDAAQTLTAAQKAQAKANIDAYGALEIGDPDTNFVTTFNAGLV